MTPEQVQEIAENSARIAATDAAEKTVRATLIALGVRCWQSPKTRSLRTNADWEIFHGLRHRHHRLLIAMNGGRRSSALPCCCKALGSHQGGVYEALAEANIHPDWIAGISIGAINAAIIAGNPPNCRVALSPEFRMKFVNDRSWRIGAKRSFAVCGRRIAVIHRCKGCLSAFPTIRNTQSAVR
jgi:hypothetical protein